MTNGGKLSFSQARSKVVVSTIAMDCLRGSDVSLNFLNCTLLYPCCSLDMMDNGLSVATKSRASRLVSAISES